MRPSVMVLIPKILIVGRHLIYLVILVVRLRVMLILLWVVIISIGWHLVRLVGILVVAIGRPIWVGTVIHCRIKILGALLVTATLLLFIFVAIRGSSIVVSLHAQLKYGVPKQHSLGCRFYKTVAACQSKASFDQTHV